MDAIVSARAPHPCSTTTGGPPSRPATSYQIAVPPASANNRPPHAFRRHGQEPTWHRHLSAGRFIVSNTLDGLWSVSRGVLRAATHRRSDGGLPCRGSPLDIVVAEAALDAQEALGDRMV